MAKGHLDAVGVVTVGGTVRQASGSSRAVAVAARAAAGGRCALRTVRVAAGSAAAVALRSRRVRGRGGRRTRVRIGRTGLADGLVGL